MSLFSLGRLKPVFVTLSLLFLFGGNLFSQDKNSLDKVFLMSGLIKVGDVKAQDETTITMHLTGQDIPVRIDKSDIVRIDFGDGETELLNFGLPPRSYVDWETKMKMYQNRIAVVPFVYADAYNKNVKENISLIVQKDCIEDLKRVNDYLKMQPADSTNLLLAQNDIDWTNIRDYSPGEICDKLGVQYVVYGSVLVTPIFGSQASSDSFATENQTQEDPKGYRTGASISPKHFETIVDVNIFDVLGETVYTNAQQSFWDTPNAYHINLDYLINESRFNQHKSHYSN